MTIPDHFQLQTGSPIYCLDWLADDVLVYAGGGGKSRTGVGNFLRVVHVPRTAKTHTDVKLLAELKLSSDEDAPMSMAVDPDRSNTLVLGINEADESKLTDNQHLRIYNFQLDRYEDKTPSITLSHQSSAPSLTLQNAAESYIRLLAFSPAGDNLLTASTDGRYALHEYPSLKPVFEPTDDFVGEELMDADFSQDGNQLVLCTGRKLKVFGTYPNPIATEADPQQEDAAVSKTEATLAINQSLGLGPKSSLDDVKATNAATSAAAANGLAHPPSWQTIRNPALGEEGGCEFRAVRFGKSLPSTSNTSNEKKASDQPTEKEQGQGDSKEKADMDGSPEPEAERKLFTVVNAKAASAGGKGTKAKRKAFLTSWKLPSTSLLLTRQLSEKPITTCALSESGTLFAYGSSDLSIGIVDAQSLRVVSRILNAHGFPATKVAWSRTSTSTAQAQAQAHLQDVWLASASADGTLRIIRVPQGSMGVSTNQTFLLTVLLTIIILLLAMYIQKNALV